MEADPFPEPAVLSDADLRSLIERYVQEEAKAIPGHGQALQEKLEILRGELVRRLRRRREKDGGLGYPNSWLGSGAPEAQIGSRASWERPGRRDRVVAGVA